MLSLSEPRCGFPLMAVANLWFGAAFLARTATLGPVFFTGFRVAAVSGNGDSMDHPRTHQQRICG